jgi:transposase-like protein
MTSEHINTIKDKFPDTESARLYLESRRWKQGPVCPFCNSEKRIQAKKNGGYYRCLSCAQVFTVRTGTVMSRSHISLEKWLYTIFLLTTSTKRVSSIELSKQIGATQKSAWYMLQRLQGVI